MGKTFRDRPGWSPKSKGRKGSGMRRGCKIHGVSNCDWCSDNLRWPDQVLEEKTREEWLDDNDE